jgi:hypothetical protein
MTEAVTQLEIDQRVFDLYDGREGGHSTSSAPGPRMGERVARARLRCIATH